MYPQYPSMAYSDPYGTCYPNAMETGFVGQTPGYIQQMGGYGARGYYRPSFWRRHRKAIIITICVLLFVLSGVGVFLESAIAKGCFNVDAQEMNEWLGNTAKGITREGPQHKVEGAKANGTVDVHDTIGSGLHKLEGAIENIMVEHSADGAGKERPVREINGDESF